MDFIQIYRVIRRKQTYQINRMIFVKLMHYRVYSRYVCFPSKKFVNSLNHVYFQVKNVTEFFAKFLRNLGDNNLFFDIKISYANVIVQQVYLALNVTLIFSIQQKNIKCSNNLFKFQGKEMFPVVKISDQINKFEDKKQQIKQTRDQSQLKQPLIDQNLFKSRSSKKTCQTYFQISFENDLLDSHKRVLSKLMNQFIGNLTENSSQIMSSLQYFQERKQNLTENNHKYLNKMVIDCAIKKLNKYSERQKYQLIIDFRSEKQLTEFILYFYSQFGDILGEQLLHLTVKVWQTYLKIKKVYKHSELQKRITEDVLKQYELMDKSLIPHLFLNDSKGGSENKQDFRNFSQKLIKTVYLVIQGYFQNPYDQFQVQQSFNCVQSLENISSFWSQDLDNDFRGDVGSLWGQGIKKRKH